MEIVVVALVFLVLLDLYIWRGLRIAWGGSWVWPWLRILFGLNVAATLGFLVWGAVNQGPPVHATWVYQAVTGLFFSFFFAKLAFAVFLLLGDMIRSVAWLRSRFGGGRAVVSGSRRRFLARTGLVVAAAPFASFVFGVVRGKYLFQVRRTRLVFPDLPEGFDGLRIVQFSDFHAGSFESREPVLKGLDLISAERPDLILFSGDLVNDRAEEFEPWLEAFARLEAPLGKFSILGNHDYGEYASWEHESDRAGNFADLRTHHDRAGFRLLNNDSVRLRREGSEIVLAGVENWSEYEWFPRRGDLDAALAGVREDDFTVLLSHDPTHWDARVRPHARRVHLTLSGHTHGMQMGVEIPGWKWSPSQYMYPRWAGLYREVEEMLYVNRGFGFLGYPGRIGIWPEVAVIELARA